MSSLADAHECLLASSLTISRGIDAGRPMSICRSARKSGYWTAGWVAV